MRVGKYFATAAAAPKDPRSGAPALYWEVGVTYEPVTKKVRVIPFGWADYSCREAGLEPIFHLMKDEYTMTSAQATQYTDFPSDAAQTKNPLNGGYDFIEAVDPDTFGAWLDYVV